MRLASLRIPMPLLVKELTEQAARKRTYILRVVYAVLLYVPALLMLNSISGRAGNGGMGVMGSGKEVFDFLFTIQIAGIYLFLPAMTAGLISREKERDALSLLLLTDMGPWEIVLQKLLGRLMAMLTFIILALPLMAVAYAFGGVETIEITAAVVALLLTMLQVGSLCLMTSAFCRSTVTAFVSAYLIGLALYIGVGVFDHMAMLAMGTSMVRPDQFWWTQWTLAAVMPWMVMVTGRSIFSLSYAGIAINAIPALALSAFFIFLARVFLISRAMTPPRNMLLDIFKWLDKKFRQANVVTGGILIIKPVHRDPGDAPVAWREVYKRSLGQPQHLIRVQIFTLIPVLLVGSGMLMFDQRGGLAEGLSAAMFLLWAVVALILTVQAANAFAAERSRQTLDVLLTTPLAGRDIVKQKMAGVRRMSYVLILSLLLPIIMKSWWESTLTEDAYSYRPGQWNGAGDAWWADYANVPYLVRALVILAVLFPFISWQAAWLGLKIRRPTQAVMASLAAMAAWTIAPFLLLGFGEMLLMPSMISPTDRYLSLDMLVYLSPAGWLVSNELHQFPQTAIPAWGAVAIDALIFGSAALFYRRQCLRHADRYLGRVPEPAGSKASTPPAAPVSGVI